MDILEQNTANEEDEITAVLHDGWTISVRARVTDGGVLSGGAAYISRDGAPRCRLTTAATFDTPRQLIAVMIAKADKWVAVQAAFAPRAF